MQYTGETNCSHGEDEHHRYFKQILATRGLTTRTTEGICEIITVLQHVLQLSNDLID